MKMLWYLSWGKDYLKIYKKSIVFIGVDQKDFFDSNRNFFI